MPIEKIKVAIVAVAIIAVYIFAATLLFKEQTQKRTSSRECPLCGQPAK